MNKPEQMKTIHRVISTFGERNQKMQTLEECIELQSALFENVHRGTDNRQNIIEEMADMEIMFTQLKEIFDIKPQELEDIKDYKLTRLNHTIDKYLIKQQVAKENGQPKQTLVQIDRETSNGR